MKMFIPVLVLATVAYSSAQFFQPIVEPQTLSFNVQPPPPQRSPMAFFHNPEPIPDPSRKAIQHRAVVMNAEAEAQYPPELLNPFYKNPRIQAALAKESWFIPGEQQVKEREAEKIPRMKIFSILRNAGLARR